MMHSRQLNMGYLERRVRYRHFQWWLCHGAGEHSGFHAAVSGFPSNGDLRHGPLQRHKLRPHRLSRVVRLVPVKLLPVQLPSVRQGKTPSSVPPLCTSLLVQLVLKRVAAGANIGRSGNLVGQCAWTVVAPNPQTVLGSCLVVWPFGVILPVRCLAPCVQRNLSRRN